MLNNKFITFFLLTQTLLFYVNNSKAQTREIDFQTWTDFTFTYNIKNKTNIGGDLGARGLASINDWNQFYVRPTYQYYFNRIIHGAGGVAIFATLSDVLTNTIEFRIFQEVSFAWPSFEYVKFYHRLRFEQRFFSYQENPSLLTDIPNDFEARGRYQLSFETKDIHLGKNNSPIYFLAAWEVFSAINDAAIEQFINNQRLLGGIGHRISPRFKYEIQYIFQNSRRFTDEGLKTSEHLLRLRLFLLSKIPANTEN